MADPDHPDDWLNKRGEPPKRANTPSEEPGGSGQQTLHSTTLLCGFMTPASSGDCSVNRSSATHPPQVGFATDAGAGPARSGLMAVISPAPMTGVSSTS